MLIIVFGSTQALKWWVPGKKKNWKTKYPAIVFLCYINRHWISSLQNLHTFVTASIKKYIDKAMSAEAIAMKISSIMLLENTKMNQACDIQAVKYWILKYLLLRASSSQNVANIEKTLLHAFISEILHLYSKNGRIWPPYFCRFFWPTF